MTRPRSIAIFDVAYLGALAVTILGPVMIWPALTASVAEQAHVGANAAGTVQAMLIAGIAVMALAGVLLWWLVARRGSNIARGLVALLLGYSLVTSALALAASEAPFDAVRAVSLLGIVFTAVALAALFMPDARAWFADEPEDLA